ncbi:MAG: excalibur calcium-binding domain-containing protein [Streptomycetaceae bacterium]|nr:excalibur calcium-binding domain-containing protein [Streptomycetaceae bacterium]
MASGCGSDGKGGSAAPTPTPAATATATVTPTPTVTATATAPPAATVTQTVTAAQPPPPAAPPPTPTVAAPATVVQAYYNAINAQDYWRAWQLGGKHLASSYNEFAARFAGTAYDALTIVGVRGDVVTMQLDAVQTDGGHRYFAGTYTVRGGEIVAASVQQTGSVAPTAGSSPSYDNCADARAHTRTPIYVGQPGYAPHLDADLDGIACEPYEP